MSQDDVPIISCGFQYPQFSQLRCDGKYMRFGSQCKDYLQCIKLGKLHNFSAFVFSCLVVSNSLRPHGLQPTRFLCPWNFSGKNAGVGCHFLLQGIFLTQGANSHLLGILHCQAESLPLSHLGSTSKSVNLTYQREIPEGYCEDDVQNTCKAEEVYD